MRQIFLIASVLLSLTLVGTAQDPYKVMDWKTETTLRSYLLQIMHQQYDVRRTALAAALETPEGMVDYREQCRQKYLRLLGEMPEKTPLDAQVTGRIPRRTYAVEKVIYESRPGHHVTSNLYLPAGKGPFPAVLIFCGHEMTSKAIESYQETAILFAVLDTHISALELSETIMSYAEITERPMERDWYSYVVPGIMNYFDLPDLVAMRSDLTMKYTDQKNNENGK